MHAPPLDCFRCAARWLRGGGRNASTVPQARRAPRRPSGSVKQQAAAPRTLAAVPFPPPPAGPAAAPGCRRAAARGHCCHRTAARAAGLPRLARPATGSGCPGPAHRFARVRTRFFCALTPADTPSLDPPRARSCAARRPSLGKRRRPQMPNDPASRPRRGGRPNARFAPSPSHKQAGKREPGRCLPLGRDAARHKQGCSIPPTPSLLSCSRGPHPPPQIGSQGQSVLNFQTTPHLARHSSRLTRL